MTFETGDSPWRDFPGRFKDRHASAKGKGLFSSPERRTARAAVVKNVPRKEGSRGLLSEGVAPLHHIFPIKPFPFETLHVSHHTACRFAKKTDVPTHIGPAAFAAVLRVAFFQRQHLVKARWGKGGGPGGRGSDRKAARRAVPVRRRRSLTGIDSRATPSRARRGGPPPPDNQRIVLPGPRAC